ncbi:hypothetical protein X797_011693 [Metarhizium robertsii]|uniref:Uncharacterized protein n=2 Tax=Metarhizium robertsii TaxID=568076 RepID=E9FAM1_METRA|nr:uncharacterized protein MAA_09283 [Metarhizium robertsii ARSEF 23]EFY95207.1 hypothetical protein MAA_09283 [Metarhizium robertsii ARSEF 23]EXU95225.1 hypothetical protein X797_011693 [Metarhizium robertsii]
MRIASIALTFGAIHLAPIQCSPIAQTGDQPGPEAEAEAALSKVITGLFATGSSLAAVSIHDINGAESWRWTPDDAHRQNIPGDLLNCIKRNYAVPEAKWANGGKSVLTVFNGAALIINHLPGSPHDKKITFGTCINRGTLGNTHSLELVPDNKIAIATASDIYTENIQIFDIGRGLQANANPVEKLDSTPAVHGLVWDKQANLLWAVGNNRPPAGKTPSSSALNAYAYKGGKFTQKPVHEYKVGNPILLTTEWANSQYSGWWDGGHDLIGVPNKRQLLLSTDTDLHVFDIPSQKFRGGEAVAKEFLPGFQPVDRRVGSDGKWLPRSDVKCLSLDGRGNALYIQAGWRDVTSHQINFLKHGKLQSPQRYSAAVYKSRWFQGTQGWPSAGSH